jgi:phosphoribosylaminoimidazole carboxylase (NCAIR synthetase)
VLKTLTGGYDGYGTFFPNSLDQGMALFESEFKKQNLGLLAEKKVDFKQEMALMLFRSARGEMTSYPLVKTYQHQGRCLFVEGPKAHPHLSRLKKKLFLMMDQIDYVGALGIELFDTGKKLFVNELAPRVHNSGHFSQNAMNYSQFDLHWMCGLGIKLPKIHSLSSHFSMWNLLGNSKGQLEIPEASNQGLVHLYGKPEGRKGRKLGHVNFVNSLPKSLKNIANFQEKKK